MKQVVFAIALLAMASLTGCLNTEDSPVDENIDTTDDSTSDTTENNTDTTEDNSDTTDDTKDDELIEPVGGNGGYTPPETANISWGVDNQHWVAKDGNRITTSCFNVYEHSQKNFVIFDSDDRIIHLANDASDYGASECDWSSIIIDVTLGPEPVKAGISRSIADGTYDYASTENGYYWIITF